MQGLILLYTPEAGEGLNKHERKYQLVPPHKEQLGENTLNIMLVHCTMRF